MPPRSMNAPKSAMFLTVPLTIWPTCRLSSVFFFSSSRCCSISLRRLMTMLRRSSSILRMTASIVAADPVGDLAGPADVHLAGRQEHRHADVHQQAALDLLGDLAGDRVAFLLGLHDGFPVDDAISLALADLHQTGVALDVFQEHADFVADLDVVGSSNSAAFEDAFALEAQLDDEVVAGDAADLALDDGAGGEVLHLVAVDELVQIVGGVAQRGRDRGVDFVVEVAERVDEVVIDHSAVWGPHRACGPGGRAMTRGGSGIVVAAAAAAAAAAAGPAPSTCPGAAWRPESFCSCVARKLTTAASTRCRRPDVLCRGGPPAAARIGDYRRRGRGLQRGGTNTMGDRERVGPSEARFRESIATAEAAAPAGPTDPNAAEADTCLSWWHRHSCLLMCGRVEGHSVPLPGPHMVWEKRQARMPSHQRQDACATKRTPRHSKFPPRNEKGRPRHDAGRPKAPPNRPLAHPTFTQPGQPSAAGVVRWRQRRVARAHSVRVSSSRDSTCRRNHSVASARRTALRKAGLSPSWLRMNAETCASAGIRRKGRFGQIPSPLQVGQVLHSPFDRDPLTPPAEQGAEAKRGRDRIAPAAVRFLRREEGTDETRVERVVRLGQLVEPNHRERGGQRGADLDIEPQLRLGAERHQLPEETPVVLGVPEPFDLPNRRHATPASLKV